MKGVRSPRSMIDGLLDDMSGSKWITKPEMLAWYWKILSADYVKEKAAFKCKHVSVQFEDMPFGLTIALAMFQRKETQLFRGIGFVCMHIYDVVVIYQTMDEHVQHMVIVCGHIREACLKLKLKIPCLDSKRGRYLASSCPASESRQTLPK